tara:strand:- start:1814 stop:2866 length:1053 start_codon:yes stop_codon:yes gene_type:complete
MPFLTYSIKSELVEKFELSKRKNIEKFLNYVDLLNNKGRAILVDKKDNVLQNLAQKYFSYSKKISSNDDHELTETLNNLVSTLNDSVLYNKNNDDNKLTIDFEKSIDNDIDKDLFHKFNNDVFPPSLFGFSVQNFEDNFLNKIQTFIISKNNQKKEINSLFIFHKEASKYLEGYWGKKPKYPISTKDIKIRLEDPDEDRNYYTNVMKIKKGLDVLINWWKNIPSKYRPDNFIFLSDTPINVSKSHKYNLEKRLKIENFLFENLDLGMFKAKFMFLDPFDLRKQWWKHKRHFVFGDEISLMIDSEFGIEFVDENDSTKINNINKFVVISDGENNQLKDISQEIKKISLKSI